jgi:hypothetical protein
MAKKVTTSKPTTVKASKTTQVAKSVPVEQATEDKRSAAERAANAQGQTTIKVKPTTNGIDETVKPSSTLPEGKSLAEVQEADAAKAEKQVEAAGPQPGEVIFSVKPKETK